jgi:hypothetical protein
MDALIFKHNTEHHRGNINKWTSFEEEVINEIKVNNCKEIYNENINYGTTTKVTYKVYYLTITGTKSFNLKKEFETYGQKNMLCSRIYISLNNKIYCYSILCEKAIRLSLISQKN